MPAINISAVNTGTDTLTATAHGMLTGQRFRLRNTGGALPAATPSLGPVLDRFAIRVDADNFKAAATSADAFAGTPIDITGSGTGTHILEYGLPYCIPTALAAAGTQVKSADLNGTWNSLVAIYDLLTGQSESVWSGNIKIAGQFTGLGDNIGHGTRTLVLTSAAFVGSGTTASYARGSVTIASATSEKLFASIALPSGCRILAVRVYVHDQTIGPSTITATFFSVGTTGTATVIGSQPTSAGNNTDQTLTIGSLTTTIAAGLSYGLEVVENSSSGSTVTIYKAEVDYDRPVV